MNELKLGWLSPTGEFTECGGYEHYSAARSIAESLKLHTFDSDSYRRVDEEDAVINAGYVLIGRSELFFHGWRILWSIYHTLTPEQRRFLSPYFDDESQIEEMTLVRWKEEQ